MTVTRIAWVGAAAALAGAAALVVLALNVGRPGPAGPGDAAVPAEGARVDTREPAAEAGSADASGQGPPGAEEEVVLTNPLGGVDPSLAEVLPDFGRTLGKDDIAPIYDPVLVSAEEAGLEDGDHVMGLAIDGEARAYPVRALHSREMVNDEVAGVPVLVTW